MKELREVLEGLLTEDENVRLNVQSLAPHIKRALRVSAQEMARQLGYTATSITTDKCVTAGVEVMRENEDI